MSHYVVSCYPYAWPGLDPIPKDEIEDDKIRGRGLRQMLRYQFLAVKWIVQPLFCSLYLPAWGASLRVTLELFRPFETTMLLGPVPYWVKVFLVAICCPVYVYVVECIVWWAHTMCVLLETMGCYYGHTIGYKFM